MKSKSMATQLLEILGDPDPKNQHDDLGGNPDLTTSWSIAIFLFGGDKAVRK